MKVLWVFSLALCGISQKGSSLHNFSSRTITALSLLALRGSIPVYISMAMIGVVLTPSVIILRAWFCTMSSCLVSFGIAAGNTSIPYSSVGRSYVLYVFARVSVVQPHFTPATLHMSASLRFPLSAIWEICDFLFSFLSSVIPRYVGFLQYLILSFPR
jgi:hypothetical protein